MGGNAELDLLVQRTRKGDPEAFGTLVERFGAAVRGMCMLRSADGARADDLAQQIFLTAWQKREDLAPGGQFWPWLERIARNHLLNEWRRVQRERGMKQRYTTEWLVLQEANATPVEDADEMSSDVAQLRSCVEGLPPRLHKLVQLRYFENQSAPQIAHLTGQSPDGIRQLFVRVREKLRECMEGRRRHGIAYDKS